IYNNDGSGSVDFNNSVAAIDYRRGRFHYCYQSQAFNDGTCVKWAVRAESASGVEEDNETIVFAWADATAPPINPQVVISTDT
ncbi:MAG: hypothetical protein JSV03_10190, partial [Planctomycetota bacterium]